LKYHASFYLKSRPPVEALTISRKRGTFGPLPGQAAFALINAQWKQNEGIKQFIEEFKVTKIMDGDYEITAEEELITWLDIEQGMLRAFVEDVLLYLPEDYPALEDVPSDRRLAVYLQTKGNISNLENFFRKVSVLPSSRIRSEFLSLQKKEREKKAKQYRAAWEALSKDYEDDKPRRDLSGFFTFSWRYETNNILSLCWLELFLIAEEGLKVKVCRNCESYYVPWPANALHCSDCKKEYNSQKLYRDYLGERLTEKDKEKKRAAQAEYMRNYRKKKKALQDEAAERKMQDENER